MCAHSRDSVLLQARSSARKSAPTLTPLQAPDVPGPRCSKVLSGGTGRGPVPGTQPVSSLRSPTPSGAQMWQLFSTPAVERGSWDCSPA